MVIEQELECFVEDLLLLQLQSHLDKRTLIWRGFEKTGFGEEGIAIGIFERRKEGSEQPGWKLERRSF